MQIAKSFLKQKILPNLDPRVQRMIKSIGAGPVVSGLAAQVLPEAFQAWHRRRTFQDIYKNDRWGSVEGEKFYSGIRSRGSVVDTYVTNMAVLLEQHARELGRSLIIIDLGCGDFTVGRELLTRIANAKYVGCDIVPELILHNRVNNKNPNIVFREIDIVEDNLPDGDVCLIRQVLQHLSNADVSRVLPKLTKYHAVYITEGHPVILEGPVNPDKPIGSNVRFDWNSGKGRGLELDKAPFDRSVKEICRVNSCPTEHVVTFRVDCRT